MTRDRNTEDLEREQTKGQSGNCLDQFGRLGRRYGDDCVKGKRRRPVHICLVSITNRVYQRDA